MKAHPSGFTPTYSENNPTIEEVSQISGYVFLEFGAPSCGYCMRAEPAIEEALSKVQLPHIKVFDGRGLRLGRSFKVKLWPTLILLSDGKEVARVVRPTDTKDVKELLEHIA